MMRNIYFYVGTYSAPARLDNGKIRPGKGEGIYLLKMDAAAGSLYPSDVFRNIDNPSYLAISKDNKFLFCVNELAEYKGEASGSVSSFLIEKNGKLRFINSVSTHGVDPCFVYLNKEETCVCVTNYTTGNISLFPVDTDGRLYKASCVMRHNGHSIHPQRQQSPHPHSAIFSHKRNTLIVPDLGMDKLMTYKINQTEGTLLPQDDIHISAVPGSGPRHGEFNQDETVLYIINELNLSISAYRYRSNHEAHQTMDLMQTAATITGESEEDSGADIHIHPSGKLLFASFRGQNIIISYNIDTDSGKLVFLSKQSCGGKTPRNFTLDPTGKFLLAANQDSDNITVFSINQHTGELKQTFCVEVPSPVCIKPIWL